MSIRPTLPTRLGHNRTRLISFALLLAMLVHHWSAWWQTSASRNIPWLALLNQWDARLYTEIANEGHHGPLWAFFPLYPGVVRAIAHVAARIPPAVIGVALSTLALVTFVWLSTASRKTEHEPSTQATPWGMFLILYGPASYVFHSHHTESTFLLLSFVALYAASHGAGWTAAITAGLCIWTRNQGVLVAATVLLLLIRQAKDRTLRWAHVVLVGAVIVVLGLALLAYEWKAAGHPFAFMHAQHNWTHARSLIDILRAFWLGNPWQNTSPGSLHRHVWFFGGVVLAALHFKADRGFGTYSLLSFMPMVLQAEFVNAFRFSAVLFPLWFWAGTKLGRVRRPIQVVVVLLLVLLNHLTTRRYALGWWAY
jgi:hypothetical protein